MTALEFRGDGAVATIAYRGVLAADLPGGPRRAEVLELTGASEYGFAGGRICRIVDRS